MHRRRGALGLLALAATLLPAETAVAAPRSEKVSNEWTQTRLGNAFKLAPIRRAPAQKARAVARLRFNTEDGPPEVYLVLRRKRVSNGRLWLQVRVPARPNGIKGWVPRAALGPMHTVTTHLRVNRGTLRATLYREGKRIWSSPIGVGAPGTATPPGRFWIRERLRNLRGDPLYGPWAFGTSAYSDLSDWPGGGVVGIHGTNQPQLIPGRPSHGCIRVPNAAIRRLAGLMPVGTPVRIL